MSKKCAIDSGLPIIIIDAPYDDSDFVSFITNPELGDVCVFVDEFEKVFEEDEIDVWANPKGQYPMKRYRVFIQKCKVCNHIKSYKVET